MEPTERQWFWLGVVITTLFVLVIREMDGLAHMCVKWMLKH